MGLDWIPLGRPKPGAEGDFLSALGVLTSAKSWPEGTELPFSAGGDADEARRRLTASEITPYETLGAPRVGHDAAADAWIRDRYATARDKPPTVEEWVRRFEGHWVLELLPESDGLPAYSNAPFGADGFAFRGKFLDDCTGLLGEDLFQEAYLNHLPDQLARYGRALMLAATVHAQAHRVTEVLGLRVLNEERVRDDTPRNRAIWQVHIVAAAARWALWWSARGHGMHADW